MEESEEEGESVETYLIEKYKIKKYDILESFAKYYNVPFVEYNDNIPIRKDLIEKLNIYFLQMNCWIPLDNEGEKIIIAIDDPLNSAKIEDVKKVFPNSEFRVALKEDILNFIRLFTEGKKRR